MIHPLADQQNIENQLISNIFTFIIGFFIRRFLVKPLSKAIQYTFNYLDNNYVCLLKSFAEIEETWYNTVEI